MERFAQRGGVRLKRREWIVGLVGLAVLAGLFVYEQHVHPFDWRVFLEQFAKAHWRNAAAGVACIYVGYILRAVRWAWLMRPTKRVSSLSLLGTQVMGFTAVALIGRIADPVRPYLVAKKTQVPVSVQIAVYVVERLFDAGSMAILFFTAILLSPAGTLPHQEVFNKVAQGGLIATIAGGLFLVAVRLAGKAVATLCERSLAPFSRKLARGIGEKILAFHAGLDTLRTPADFAAALAISLTMWCLITFAYVEGVSAFLPTGQAATNLLGRCLALMAGGGVASSLQLPVIGWFTQIAALQVMLGPLFGMTAETAMACAATLLAITFLSIAPIGLLWAQFEHISLRQVTKESESGTDGQQPAAAANEAVTP